LHRATIFTFGPVQKVIKEGLAIEPLYKTLPAVVKDDTLFYELLIITDTIRIGRSRDIKIAVEELEKRLQHG
jgi:hypothetical protein